MRTEKKFASLRSGFSIVELLTVMGVIAILIALLVPALNMVRDYSKEIQQKSQFHAIEVGVELFKNEFGMYPESGDNMYMDKDGDGALDGAAETYAGANKLAEAMVGWDLLGVHPKSEFMNDGLSPDDSVTIYDTNQQNLEEREEQFIELENANAFELWDIYKTNEGGEFDTNFANYVLCDVFAKGRYSGVKTGMPILYFKAHKDRYEQDSANDFTGSGSNIDDDIYDYSDNFNLVNLGDPVTGNAHPLADGEVGAGTNIAALSGAVNDTNDMADFDDMIVNDKISAISSPYKAKTYILISAGKDGLYGTSDDITNFTKEN
ncbi:type II secretion system protein G [Anaerohalosphaera lusitana]|uniref:Type II secretion system protein G n=1 Tax=Anaerohalosphaera lusitana TaxID=1936003 RepID=A0A1U9NKQ7_9BACT|nr:type II secretion system protein [Anaerohalosphaera lusitana]AQT68522.1 type II secretion system protein G [Anaerohalosphaera lusitana]